MPNFFKDQLEVFVNKQFNGNWAKAAQHAGMAATTLQSSKEGAKPREDTIVRIAKAFNLSCDWLLTGEGPMLRNEIIDRHPIDRTPALSQESALELHKEGLVYIPAYSMVAAAAGGGSQVDYEFQDDAFAFREDWAVQEMGLNPRRAAMISVEGDSMIPTLDPGDLIMIDLRDCENFSRDAIYVFHMDNGLFVKRIQRTGRGQFKIKSDNPLYETRMPDPIELETLRIIGRVVWVGKRM